MDVPPKRQKAFSPSPLPSPIKGEGVAKNPYALRARIAEKKGKGKRKHQVTE